MIALLQAKAAGLWSRSHIRNNVLDGVVVGIVALPLAMAFAIASGARPEQGLYTAIVAALLTSIFGGTRVQISGPTVILILYAVRDAIDGTAAISENLPTTSLLFLRWSPLSVPVYVGRQIGFRVARRTDSTDLDSLYYQALHLQNSGTTRLPRPRSVFDGSSILRLN